MMYQIDSEIKSVKLIQGNSFQPKLQIVLDLRYNREGTKQSDYVDLMEIKGKLSVRMRDDWFELCTVEQDGNNVRLNLGSNNTIGMTGILSPFLMLKLEELRSGHDLYFKIEQLAGWGISKTDSNPSFETIILQSRGSEFKYPRSEWIDHLNATKFNKIELVELPRIELPRIALTEQILKFTNNARRAFDEGRYGDVLKESRNVLDVLDSGIEEWAKTKPELKTEIDAKRNNDNDKRKKHLSLLLNDDEKAKRLVNISRNLHYYLSLDPHAAEYKGMVFTHYDAEFVIHAVTGMANSILRHIENNTKS